GAEPSYQVFDVQGANVASAKLEPSSFPLPSYQRSTTSYPRLYKPWRFGGAVSPGGNYVALGGPRGVILLNAADGHVVGELSAKPADGWVDYQGMSFSEDGAQLRAIIRTKHPLKDEQKHAILWVWSMEDGRPRRMVDRTDLAVAGTPISGPDLDTLF